MKSKTLGIVLGYIKYKETSIIAKIYTQSFGLRSYIINGVRSVKGKGKIALYQPLTQLDLVVYEKGGDRLNRLAEASLAKPYEGLGSPEKAAVCLFLADVLSKSLKESDPDEKLFGFLTNSFYMLDTMKSGFENFHIQFLLKMTRFLGFFPENAGQIARQLNLQLHAKAEETIDKLIEGAYTDRLGGNRDLRAYLLDLLLAYYQLHIENMGEVKSHLILKELFDLS